MNNDNCKGRCGGRDDDDNDSNINSDDDVDDESLRGGFFKEISSRV